MIFIDILFHFEETGHLNSINIFYLNASFSDLTGKLNPVSLLITGDRMLFKVKRIEQLVH